MKRPSKFFDESADRDGELCPLCDTALIEENGESTEGLISCHKCGREFHLACSGVQDGWADHWQLECEHQGLTCSSSNVRHKVKGMVKQTNSRAPSVWKKPRNRMNQPILRWVVRESPADRKRKYYR